MSDKKTVEGIISVIDIMIQELSTYNLSEDQKTRLIEAFRKVANDLLQADNIELHIHETHHHYHNHDNDWIAPQVTWTKDITSTAFIQSRLQTDSSGNVIIGGD